MTDKATFADYKASADYISDRIGGATPDVAVILGSGLGSYADELTDTVVIPYREIPHFPISTVSYQKGELVYGRLGDKKVLAMNGRFHYYEGWEMWQTAYPIGVFKLLGIDKMIITNAAGGIVTGFPTQEDALITGNTLAGTPALYPILKNIVADCFDLR